MKESLETKITLLQLRKSQSLRGMTKRVRQHREQRMSAVDVLWNDDITQTNTLAD